MTKITLAQEIANEVVIEHIVFRKLKGDAEQSVNQYLDYWNRVYEAVYDFLDGRDNAKDEDEKDKAIDLARSIPVEPGGK